MLRKDLAADRCRIGRGGRYAGAVGTHDLAAERFLFIGDLYHINFTVKIQISARHGKGGTPLAGTCFGGHAFETLILRVERLCDRGVELVAAAGVVAFIFVVDLRRCAELFFQTVSADERGGPVHLVEITDLLRDLDVAVIVVEFLLDKLFAEYAAELLGGHRLPGAGVEKGRRLFLHIRPHVIPFFRHFLLGEIDLVRDLVHVFHRSFLSYR